MPQLDPIIFFIIVNFVIITFLFFISFFLPLVINYIDLLQIILRFVSKFLTNNFLIFNKYLNFFNKQLTLFNSKLVVKFNMIKTLDLKFFSYDKLFENLIKLHNFKLKHFLISRNYFIFLLNTFDE
jgi:hypothetical protein